MPKQKSPLPPELAAIVREWARRGDTPHHQVCAHCGSSFVARKRWSKYCRATCRTTAWRKRTRTQKETS